jgi:hypothetical protein
MKRPLMRARAAIEAASWRIIEAIPRRRKSGLTYCSDPGRILGAMNAVVFDNAATSNWFALGQSDHAIRHSIQFRVAPEPVQNNLGRVASLAPPLFVDPAPNGLEVLWALR